MPFVNAPLPSPASPRGSEKPAKLFGIFSCQRHNCKVYIMKEKFKNESRLMPPVSLRAAHRVTTGWQDNPPQTLLPQSSFAT